MKETCKECIYIVNLKADIDEHKETIDQHGKDIALLKADSREYKTEIKNLI